MFRKSEVRGIDLLMDLLRSREWLSKDEAVAETGFSRSLIGRRLAKLCADGVAEYRPSNIESGGRIFQYRLVDRTLTLDGRITWSPKELDEALGGFTFLRTKRHKPTRRHHLFH